MQETSTDGRFEVIEIKEWILGTTLGGIEVISKECAVQKSEKQEIKT
jgi:hypothetical protein